MVKNIVIYDKAGLTTIFSIIFHIMKKSRIYYFSINPAIYYLFRFKRNSILESVPQYGNNDLKTYYMIENRIVNDTEIFETYISEKYKSQLEFLRIFFNSKLIDRYYLKKMMERCSEHSHKLEYIHGLDKIINDFEKYSVSFIINAPIERFIVNYIKENFNQPYNIRIIDPKISNWMKNIFLKSKWLIIQIGLLFYVLFSTVYPYRNTDNHKKFDIGFRIYMTDWAFDGRYRKIDFLIDDEKINSENCIFIIEDQISDEYKSKLEKRRYNYVFLRGFLKNICFRNKIEIFKNFLPLWKNVFFGSIYHNQDAIKLNSELLYSYVNWNALLNQIEFKKYITYNHFNHISILRNIILQQRGISTFFYEHSCNNAYVYTPLNSEVYKASILSNLNYDDFVIWNEGSHDFLIQNKNINNHYLKLGCIWSEHIKIIKKESYDDLHDSFLGNFKNSTIPRYILGVFDTSFGASPLSEKDIIRFNNDVVALLNCFPQIAVIYSPKVNYEYIKNKYPEVQGSYEKLIDHNRCLFIKDKNLDSTEAIAVSDLVISSCYTSTTIEAIGAGQKAIYYDATEKFRGTYYDKYPMLVAHGFKELCLFINYWLSFDDKHDYDNFLIEKYLDLGYSFDGKGISNFREILIEN